MVEKLVQFILIDYHDQSESFSKYFSGISNWTFYMGALDNLKHYDCLVTPGNSFGDMTGGFDVSVVDLFGEQIQKRVRDLLRKKYPSDDQLDDQSWDSANQPIGTSILVETGSVIAKYLCHTPTMESVKSIKDKPNVYMAMNSILYEVLKHNKARRPQSEYINTVILPFLGTGFGELTYDESAKQMRSAFVFYKENYPEYFG